jgi:hypothetical protein
MSTILIAIAVTSCLAFGSLVVIGTVAPYRSERRRRLAAATDRSPVLLGVPLGLVVVAAFPILIPLVVALVLRGLLLRSGRR